MIKQSNGGGHIIFYKKNYTCHVLNRLIATPNLKIGFIRLHVSNLESGMKENGVMREYDLHNHTRESGVGEKEESLLFHLFNAKY